MPRNASNFWIELDVDGRKNVVATGPRSKDGGFSMTIYMRGEGGVEIAARIYGSARGGSLNLSVFPLASLPTEGSGFTIRSKR